MEKFEIDNKEIVHVVADGRMEYFGIEPEWQGTPNETVKHITNNFLKIMEPGERITITKQ